MSWLLVDDKFHAHKKARRAGAEALGLWVMCGSHAAGMDVGGLLEADEVETIALTMRLTNWKRAAAKLVDVGLWDAVEAGYQIHDFDHYRKGADREQIRREKDAERKRLKRDVRGHSADVSADTSSDVSNTGPRTPENTSADAPSRARAPVHSVPFSPVPSCADAIPNPDAGEPAGSGGDLLDMSSLRRLWNENRERVTGSMLPAIHDADANAVLATLPKVRSVAPRPKASFADWLAVEFEAWHDAVTKEHGANATRITRAWSPVSFAGWYERNPPPAEAAPSRPVQAPQAPEGPPAAKEPATAPLSAEERVANAAALLAKMDAAREASQRPRFQA